MKKIILDCDPGMDDSMAIVMAAKSEVLDLLAVTTVNGNYPAEITAKNARKVLEMLGRTDIPVRAACGSQWCIPAPRIRFPTVQMVRRKTFCLNPKWRCTRCTQSISSSIL